MKQHIGENIRRLRTQKGITQETLAEHLHISAAAVSKWERNETLPDVALIPAIASYFAVAIDELFSYDIYEIEKEIDAIVAEHCKHRDNNTEKAERVIREGLKKYPGNDILLNCLLYVLDVDNQSNEIIDTARRLTVSANSLEVRLDAFRIMAEAYIAQGKFSEAKQALENIPEIYFTKLELIALLLDGEECYEAAQKQKNISAEKLINMLIVTGKRLREMGEEQKAKTQFKIAKKVIDAFEDDFTETRWFKSTVYDMKELREEISRMLHE